MSWFAGGGSYDRRRILEAASLARRRGRRRKALRLYGRVLEAEPGNPEIERRVAGLLAETKRPEAAWQAYQRAAGDLAERGFVDQAIGIYRDARRYLPEHEDLWRCLADLEVERGRKPDAVATLLEARRRLRRRRQRPAAIRLLEHGRRIAPRHFETNFELAGLLARDGAPRRAARLLAELAECSSGAELRRVRARQLRLAPTPAAAWRWLRSLAGHR
jgi:tetratricopeptide (TPR) repeat protein